MFTKIHAAVFQVSFQHDSRPANGMADVLAKQRVDCTCNHSAFITKFCWSVVYSSYTGIPLLFHLIVFGCTYILSLYIS